MATAIISIIAAVLAATMTGIGIWQADKANKENQQLALENREDQQAFATQAAQQANQATEHRYWNLYSPSSTVNQLKAAGLSPGLFYGQGGSGGQNVSAAQAATPSSAPAVMNPTVPGDIFSQIFGQTDWNEVRKTDSDIKVNETSIQKAQHEMAEIDANIKKIEEQTKTEVVSRAGMELDNQMKEIDKKIKEATADDQINIMKEQLNIMRASYDKTLKEIEGLDIDNKNKQELIDLTKRKMTADIAKTWAEQRNTIADTVLKKAETALKRAETRKTNAETANVKQQTQKLKKEVRQLEQAIKEGDMKLEYLEEVGYQYGTASGALDKAATAVYEISNGVNATVDEINSSFDEMSKEWQNWSATGGH